MGEHRTAKLKRKPGRRANQQASVARTARNTGRPQHANDNHGPKRRVPHVPQAQSADGASNT